LAAGLSPSFNKAAGIRSTTWWHEAISTASTIDRLAIIKRIAEAQAQFPVPRQAMGRHRRIDNRRA
jgi:hypothetical protein